MVLFQNYSFDKENEKQTCYNPHMKSELQNITNGVGFFLQLKCPCFVQNG